MMDDLIGHTFGGYQLKELVGTGGVASIFKGYDERLARWVAIKVIPVRPALGQSEETHLARFRLEAQAIAALRHRNILTIYGYGEEDGWAYIVMEYVPGGSLKDRIKLNEPFSWETALTIIIPVSEALAFAHKHNIIHRDIKPANILLPQDDWPLLADFGLAKMEHSTRPNLTMPGQVLGTMAYAAPEQIQEGDIDSRIDIYSLGIVLYELLTGRLPFTGETSFDFLMARITEPPHPIQEANPDVSPIFVPILDKALVQEPAKRYQTMDEFSNVLIGARRQLRMEEYERMRTGAGDSPPVPRQDSMLESKQLRESAISLKLTATGEQIQVENKTELIVGRAHKKSRPDIDLGPHGGTKAGVSRQHGRFVRKGNDWFVEDMGSTNGTFVNGTKIPSNQLVSVKMSDKIRFGQIELEFQLAN